MPIDETIFRKAMGSFLSGVTVVTTRHDNQLYGMTVSSFCSLSLQPQLLLVCITNTLPTHHAILKSGKFAVNILSQPQAHVSQHFASRAVDKFADVEWGPGPDGQPLLTGCCAVLECTLAHVLPGGDHSIVVGAVNYADVNHELAPLAYHRGAYHHLA